MNVRLFAPFVAFAVAASPALAQPVIVADSGDSAWTLAAAVLVLIAALPALALLGGRDRAAPGTAVLLSSAIAALAFGIIGYSLAFGEGSNVLGGVGNAFLSGLADLRDGTTIPESVYVLYETAVAMFALAIVGSAVADRARLAWFVPFAVLWALLVYVPVARWMWGGGWLAGIGALDFAGGIVVQTAAGTAALVIGLLLRGSVTAHRDDALLAPATGLLMLGWLGVVGGAALAGGDDAASAMIDALLGGSAGLLTGMAIGKTMRDGTVGVIAALAAVSTSAGFVGPMGAIIIAVVAALAASFAAPALMRYRLGAAGDAFAASGLGGIIGAVLFPVFVLPALGGPGLEAGASIATQLAAQAIAVLAIILWTAVATVIAALTVSMVVPMRSVAGTDTVD